MALLFPHRDSPLISAARHGLVRDVEDLLAYGRDANQAHRGTTPLYIACQEGHGDVVTTLLVVAANADVNPATKATPRSPRS